MKVFFLSLHLLLCGCEVEVNSGDFKKADKLCEELSKNNTAILVTKTAVEVAPSYAYCANGERVSMTPK